MKINGSLIFDASSASEIQNLRVQKVASNPVHAPADIGRLIYNTGDNVIYIGGASNWVALATGGNAAALQSEVDAIEAALGSMLNGDGTFNAAAFTGTLAGLTSVQAAIAKLQDLIGTEVTDRTNADAALQAEIDATQTGAGLAADGTYAAVTGSNYLNTSSSLKDAALKLDTALKVVADALAAEVATRTLLSTEVDAIESAVGLNTDGTLAAFAADGFVEGQATFKGAVEALDAQLVIVTDDLADEIARATAEELDIRADFAAADTALQTNIDGKVAKAGDSMDGNLAFQGTHKVTGLAAPTAGGDAANKAYVDNLLAGLTWEAPVDHLVADVTARDALTGLASGDRVYVHADSKIYTFDGAAFDAGELMVDGASFFHTADETGYVYNGTALVQFTGGGQLTAGVGLVKVGNTIDVNLGAGIAQLPTDEVGVDVMGTGGLFLTVDGTAASTDSAAQLAVKLDGSSITRGANGIKVSDALTAEIADLRTDLTAAETSAGELQTEVNAVEAAVGLNADGTLVAFATGGYAEGKATVKAAIEGIDAALKAEETARAAAVTAEATARGNADTALQGEIDALETKVGKMYFLYDGAAASSHTVTHSLGQKYCNVTVVDATDEVVIPQSITFTSANALTVTFNTAIACKVIVMGLAA